MIRLSNLHKFSLYSAIETLKISKIFISFEIQCYSKVSISNISLIGS